MTVIDDCGACTPYEEQAHALIGDDESETTNKSSDDCIAIVAVFLEAKGHCKNKSHQAKLTAKTERWIARADAKSSKSEKPDPQVLARPLSSETDTRDALPIEPIDKGELVILQSRSKLFGNKCPPVYKLNKIRFIHDGLSTEPVHPGDTKTGLGLSIKGIKWMSVKDISGAQASWDEEHPVELTPTQIVTAENNKLENRLRKLGWDEVLLGPSYCRNRLDIAIKEQRMNRDLCQGQSRNCSVVAALSAIYASRSHLIDDMWSDEGFIRECREEQVFRLYFNGAFRAVSIDNKLPVLDDLGNRPLYVTDSKDDKSFAPALLEKAIMQIRGGYDSHGGNTGQDIMTFTGWIPDVYYLKGENSRELQDRLIELDLLQQHAGNLVMITAGTNPIPDEEAEATRLTSRHAYTVMHIRLQNSEDCTLELLLKNTWSTYAGEMSEKNPMTDEERGEKLSLQEDVTKLSIKDISEQDFSATSRGLLRGDVRDLQWRTLDEMMHHFHSITLNWSPARFQSRRDAHFLWSRLKFQRCAKSRNLLSHNQYLVRAHASSSIWVLLQRHYMGSSEQFRPLPNIENLDEETREKLLARKAPHIALYVFGNCGKRALNNDEYLDRTFFTDDRHVLLKLDAYSHGEPLTVVPMCDNKDPETLHRGQTFTMSVFSDDPALQLSEAQPALTHQTSASSSWVSGESAGGDASHTTYFTNPQFLLTLPAAGQVSLVLAAEEHNFFVHSLILRRKTSARDLVAHEVVQYPKADANRKGSHIIEDLQLEAGQYVIVCSTQNQHDTSDFTLMLLSGSAGATLARLPPEGAGLFLKDFSFRFPSSLDQAVFPITFARAGEAQFVVEEQQVHGPLKLRIQLLDYSGRKLAGDGMECLRDCLYGVRTEMMQVVPAKVGEQWQLVVEREGERTGGGEREVEVKIWGSVAVKIC